MISNISPAKNENGLTLLEVLAAVSILGIAVVILFQLFASGMRLLYSSEDYVRAVMRCEEKMRLLLDDPELNVSSWSEAAPDGHVLKISVTEIEKEKTAALKAKLLQVDVRIDWKKGGAGKSYVLSTIRERSSTPESGSEHGL